MLGISEAAEKIGFRTMGVQISFQQLLEDAPLPCIVHWNQQHFVVVYRMSKGQVWVADPGAGKVKYAQEEFCNCWQSNKKKERRQVLLYCWNPHRISMRWKKKTR